MNDDQRMPREVFERELQNLLPHQKVVAEGDNVTGIEAGDRLSCDFCSTQFPLHTKMRVYKADDVIIDDQPDISGNAYGSLGDWAACPTCATLIDNDQRALLLEHSLNKACEKWGNLQRGVLRKKIRQSHDAFFKARIAD